MHPAHKMLAWKEILKCPRPALVLKEKEPEQEFQKAGA